MIEAIAWQAETRYEHAKNEMAMGAFGRVAVLSDLMRPMPQKACLFAAPEFLFRDTKNHFQTAAAKDEIVKALLAVSAKFPQVLMLPGTIPWVERVAADECWTLYSEYRLQQLQTSLYPTPEARAAHERLIAHARGRTEALATATHVYLARNSLYAMQAGKLVCEYHKRHEAIGDEIPPEITGRFDLPIYFPPQQSTPYFEQGGVTYGLEICADHEYCSLGAALGRGSVKVHVIVSDEVYPTQEHCQAKWLVHAGRETAGIYDRSRLPSIANGDLEAVTRILDESSSGDKVTTKHGPLYVYGLPIP